MDTRYPNESEAIQLRKLHATSSRKPLYLVLSGIVTSLFMLYVYSMDIQVGIVLAIVSAAIVAQIYLMLSLNILTKCPRCERRMTVLKGSCTHCGIYLDLRKVEKPL